MTSSPKRFHSGSALNPDADVYVARPEDSLLEKKLSDGSWGAVTACRTMGKTSLVYRYITVNKRLSDRQFALIDVAYEIEEPVGPDEWLQLFSECLHEKCNLARPSDLEKTKEPLGPRLATMLRKVVQLCQRPVTLFLDEIDKILDPRLTYGGKLVGAFRYVANRQAIDPGLKEFQLCTIGLRSLNELVDATDPASSPIGWRLTLDDFEVTDKTARHLTEGFNSGEKAVDLAYHILKKTHGHPSLTSLFCRDVYESGEESIGTADAIIRRYIEHQRAKPFDLVNQIRGFLTSERFPRHERFAALSTYRGLLRAVTASEEPGAPGAELLQLCGLVRERKDRLEITNEILRDCCTEKFVNQLQSEFGSPVAYTAVTPGDKPNVLLINIGGTIGMVEQEGKVKSPETVEHWLQFYPELNSLVTIHPTSIFNCDSANIFPHNWTELAEYIYERRNDGYCGVVVAMGTDTMAYVACALALAFGPQWRLPVVLTGAQAPPNTVFGDARDNLYRACRTALCNIPEVVICFGNYVFRGTRAQKKDDRGFDGFGSPSYPPLVSITGEFQVNQKYVRTVVNESGDVGDSSLKAQFSDRVVTIKQSPGLDPAYFYPLLDPETYFPQIDSDHFSYLNAAKRLKKPVEGIVFQSLGAGNVPTQVPYTFIPFIRDARSAGIPVVITNQYAVHPMDYIRYEPGATPILAGAIPVGDMTAEAAETKLRWVLAQLRDRRFGSPHERVDAVKKMMHSPVAGEIGEMREATEPSAL